MITIDGVQYRNLEEQVKKNKDDIAYILEEEGVLNQFGIKIVDEVESVGDLPDPTTYEGEFGDAYAVGTTTPYTLYIFTRANGSHATNYWFNIGQFPLPGPMGPAGAQGEDGETGLPALQDKGHRTTSTVPIIGMALGTAASNFNRTPVVGDTFFQLVLGLDGTSAEGRSWITNNEITSIGSLCNYRVSSVLETTGAQGPQGNTGAAGAPGPVGAQGPIGPQGNPGQSFVIAGTVANEGQLPDPSTLADNIAYLVGTAAPYDLYVQLQDSSEWFNAGIVEGVQGPMGPQGPMPPLVSTRGTSTTDAISQQGIENIFYNTSVVLGQDASTRSTSSNCVAIGYDSYIAGTNGTTVGPFSRADENGVAIGCSAGVGMRSVAVGAYANVGSTYKSGVAIGYGSMANGNNSTVIGANAQTSYNHLYAGNVTVVGYRMNIQSNYSTGLGVSSNINGNSRGSIVIGASSVIGNNASNSLLIGSSSMVLNNARQATSVGTYSVVGAENSTAIGYMAQTNQTNSIQLGQGECNAPNTFQVGNYSLLDLTNGLIPSERISQNIPTVTDNGDGTISITANGSTYKVAIVTE